MNKIVALICFVFLLLVSVDCRPSDHFKNIDQLLPQLMDIQNFDDYSAVHLNKISQEDLDYYSELLTDQQFKKELPSSHPIHPHRRHKFRSQYI
ncbi:hypothetical protein M3Y95_00819800 [Aphelenchoides besseyi]|nr:hypothetical protein M3Y95_00819800 [Aphelenchoides besseyi]